MSDNTTSPRRRAAVEAAAEVICDEIWGAGTWAKDNHNGPAGSAWTPLLAKAIAAYLAAMGCDVEAQQVRRIADER
jgi:hypothetical protein